MTRARQSVDQIWKWLGEVPDPEIPVVSVTDLGVVRDVVYVGDTLVVSLTPTYSGCPATAVINLAVEDKLRAEGIHQLRLERRLSPPWTTDWMNEGAREKLKAFGIAPPSPVAPVESRLAGRVDRLLSRAEPVVECPRCGSTHTEKISQFGSTPCKASYRCRDCLEPFEYFKCL